MIYDLIIIGGGPAGITAGIYAARKKLKTLLLAEDFIGQVGKTGRIDNWPGDFGISGLDLLKKFKEHLRKFAAPSGRASLKGREIEIVDGEEVTVVSCHPEGGPFASLKGRLRPTEGSPGDAKSHFFVKTESGKEFLGRAVIIATGRDPRPLEVPGEKEFIGRGVSYCSICEAPFFKDKSVAVIGGGNSGFEAALDLVSYAKRIFIFERGDKVTADEILQEQVRSVSRRMAEEKKIEVHLNKEVKKIEGKDKVQDMIYQDLKTKKTFQVPIDGVFVQIGSVPATAFVKGLVEFNEQDEIKVDLQTCQTSTPGIFAAGDVNDGKWKQIIIAAGEGCRAALAAYEYLQGK